MKKIIYLLMCLFLVLGGVSVYAQTGEEELTEEEKSGLVSFDFKDADVRNVLRIFSHKTAINIVASSDVVGSVTVKLNNVPWEKALKIILEMNDFAYVREGNVIKVLTRDRITQEPLKTEVITLDYAKASTVKATIETMLSERGKVQVDERANLLIVTDIPSSFDPIMNVIKRLDLPTPQVLIETKLIETTVDVQEKYGVKWGFLDEYTVSYGGGGETNAFMKAKSIEKGNAWTFGRDLSEDLGSFTETYGPLMPDSNDGSGNWTNTINGTEDGYVYHRTEVPDAQHPWFGISDSVGSAGLTKSATNTVERELASTYETETAENFVLSASGLSVVMSALQSDNGTDILSAPSIVTMDNIEAFIKVASDYPIPNYSYNEDIGRYEITGFTPTPIGITMRVKPKVAPNGYVTMQLNPEISNNDGNVYFGTLDVNIPKIGKENIKTTVMVKDGDTVVLGGLMKQNDIYNNQQVPLLHSIPFLGWLFKYKDKKIEKRNLLVFVTPTIIKQENASTVTQNRADEYTKMRDGVTEPTTIYPTLEE